MTEPSDAAPAVGAEDAAVGLRELITQALYTAEGEAVSWKELDRDKGPFAERIRSEYRRLSDAVLALPALRDLAAAAEKVRRVEKIIRELETWDEGFLPQGRGAEVQHTFARVQGRRLRRALNGEDDGSAR